MPIPNNYIAGAILVLGILLTIWCIMKGEGYAKQIKWILIFFFLAAFVMSDKFDTLKGLKILADLTNLDRYVGQVKEVTAEGVQKLNETYELKLESFQALSLAKLEKTEKLANEAKTLMRLSLESVIYDQAIKDKHEIIRKRIKSVAPHLFDNDSERDQWTKSMMQALDKK
jgi:hypothetical protein